MPIIVGMYETINVANAAANENAAVIFRTEIHLLRVNLSIRPYSSLPGPDDLLKVPTV
jgi:hypothetical protein